MTHSGALHQFGNVTLSAVLIPLLLDDPLWDAEFSEYTKEAYNVLIPLLLDDPLWGWFKSISHAFQEWS